MNALFIAWKDMQIFFRERGRLIMLFLLPMVFILAFSAVYGAMGSDVGLVKLAVVNLDADGEAAQELIARLNQSGAVEVELSAETEAQRLLEQGDSERYLTIPAGFTDDIAAGRQVTLLITNGADANESRTEAVKTITDGIAKDLSLQTQLITGFQQMGEMMLAGPEEARVFTTERIVAQAESQFERAKTAPLVAVEQKVPDVILQKQEDISGADISVPGFAVLFGFMTAQVTAASIYTEKKIGSFRRLLAAPLTKAELLGGKMLPNLITALLQIAVIFGASILLLPLLGMDAMSMPHDPLAVVVLSLLVALCSTSLGLLIASIARTESQIGGFSTVALWVMGLVGGAFIPAFFLGEFLNSIGKIVPHYWAILAYQNLLVRGQNLVDITPQLAALVGFTAVFAAIGLWRFKFDA
jgi:ABC-2 type transport system permease protein